MPPESHLEAILKDLTVMTPADRAAIMKRLSGAERKALAKAEREARIPTAVRALNACSPWLAGKIASVVRSDMSRSDKVTEPARRALIAALETLKPAPLP